MKLQVVQLFIGISLLAGIFFGSTFYLLLEKPQQSLISGEILEPPSEDHLLGTTDLGEDLFVQLVQGTLPTMVVGLAVGLCVVFIGFLVAAFTAFGGIFVNRIVLRLVDIMSAVPSMVAIILITSVLRPSMFILIVILVIFDWHVDVRTFRAKIKVESVHGAVVMAKLLGGSRRYLIYRHILPACYPLLITRILQTTRRAIFKMAGLAFLGVTDPDMVSWGGMLKQSLPYLTMDCWQHWTLPPILLLFLTLGSLLLINNYVEQRWFLASC